MADLDQQLIAAFARMDKPSRYIWLDEQAEDDDFKPSLRGYMMVPLNKETFEEMQAASVFTGQWATKTKKVMGKPRLFRVVVSLYEVGVAQPQEVIAQMLDRDTVHVLWPAIDEASMFIMTLDKNKDAEWDVDRCRAVIKV